MSIIDIIYKLYISEADSMTAAPFRNFPGLNGDGNLNFFSRGCFFFPRAYPSGIFRTCFWKCLVPRTMEFRNTA